MSYFLPKATAFALGVVFFVSNSVFAQIPVALPTEYYDSREVTLPVTVGEVSGQDVKAFLLTMTYDESIFEVTGVDAQGCLAEGFSLILNADKPGQITIAGAHFEAISGDGTLMHVTGKFRKKGTTDLTLNSFAFNEGNPQVATINGQISNSVRVSNEDEGHLPSDFQLRGNYPNPFNPTTTIQFDLPEAAEVTIKVVDLLGREVMTLPSQMYQAGASQRVDLDASSLASGVYIYQMKAHGVGRSYVSSSTMTLLK